jgi:hypothetical protein
MIVVQFVPTAFTKPRPKISYTEAVISASGDGELNSDICKHSGHMEAVDLAPFESALSNTDFSSIPEQEGDHTIMLDYPPELLLEAYVGGKYHFVHADSLNKHLDVLRAWLKLTNLRQRLCQ